MEVVTSVKQFAKTHHSATLVQLDSCIAAVERFGTTSGENPFTKIEGLISDVIPKLEFKTSSEATERAYGNERMTKPEQKKAEWRRISRS